MADSELLDLLRQNVPAWNQWRREAAPWPDLSEANLIGADLRGANLRLVNLTRADLSGANLSRVNLKWSNLAEADLREAILRGAKMKKAVLSEANLTDANLYGANMREAVLLRSILSKAELSGANLTGANLMETNLSGASLTGAELGGSHLRHTIFFQTKLEGAKGLESINHLAPSNLDHFTIARSDPLPISFLRGCGLPDLIIDNIEALRGDAIQFYSCFISYSNNNHNFAERLHADLQNKGIRCWFAPHDLRGGRKTHHQINEAIRLHDKLVLILSGASMNSNWVEYEIRKARERELKEDRRVLFPIGLVPYEALQEWELFDADEGRDLAKEIREFYIPDFTNWKNHDKYRKEFGKLVEALQASGK